MCRQLTLSKFLPQLGFYCRPVSLDWSLSQPIKFKKSPVLPLERTYWSIVLLICFIIPIIVLIGSYAGLVLQIVRVQRNIKNMGNSSGKNKSRQSGINEHFRSKSFKWKHDRIFGDQKIRQTMWNWLLLYFASDLSFAGVRVYFSEFFRLQD